MQSRTGKVEAKLRSIGLVLVWSVMESWRLEQAVDDGHARSNGMKNPQAVPSTMTAAELPLSAALALALSSPSTCREAGRTGR